MNEYPIIPKEWVEYPAYSVSLSDWLGAQLTLIVTDALGGTKSIAAINMAAIKERCRWQIFPDGKQILLLDGNPIVEVLPVNFIERDGKYFAEQTIRRLRA